MAEILTNKGAQLLAQHQGNGTHLNVNKFILALIPGQDSAAAIDPNRGLPSAGQIVHEQMISDLHKGYLAPDMVSYSLFMGENVGPFTFNTIYSIATDESNAVIQIITLPDTPKIATDEGAGIRGQAMVRNAVLVYDNAQAITNVTVEADAWQFDFEKATTDHAGMGEVATDQEVIAGKDKWRWVTPFTLHRYIAEWWENVRTWTNIKNKPDFKSAALLDAGQNDGQVALIGRPDIDGKTAVVINSGSNGNGFWRIWSDGFIQQWGNQYQDVSYEPKRYLFPIGFENADSISIALNSYRGQESGNTSSFTITKSLVDRHGFTAESSNNVSNGMFFMAEGY